ncbi:hypothetical protein [Terasakiella sp. SH-1]|uniref:hypothetical protein n=1 Tax=Terasakiella sp. SH-1 TaxID=2560057 RepID=UPI0010733267|nr:hypothetical protein [Terasakiella sp. SH-1]
MSAFVEITREMGTNHKDFLRLLPKAVPQASLTVKGDAQSGAQVVIENAPTGRIEVELSEESERRIALLTLPVTHITFRFFGVDEDIALAEYNRMAKTFQRGGG